MLVELRRDKNNSHFQFAENNNISKHFHEIILI